MTQGYDSEGTGDGAPGADSAVGDGEPLPEIERDEVGIPTFVFRDKLAEDDKPTDDKRTLEVVMLWREAVMRVGHYTTAKPVTVGDGVKNDFRVPLEGLPVSRFHLLDPAGDGDFNINWTEDMAIEVRDGQGERQDGSALLSANHARPGDLQGKTAYTTLLGLHDRVAVRAGEVTFVIQYVSPVRIIQASLLSTIDYYFTKILALSAIAHLALLLALLLAPQAPEPLDDDLFKNPNRFTELILREPAKPRPKRALSGTKAGGRHRGDEGKFGKPDKPKNDAQASKPGAPIVDPSKRELDRLVAQNSGLLKALSGSTSAAVSNVLGSGGLGIGFNNAVGGLRGTAMGDAGGSRGFSTRGTGSGGGGTSLGIGGLGKGSGRGTGGLGKVDLGGRGIGKSAITSGRTITKGCLTQSQVLRVIGRIRRQAKYCYDKELTANPNLAGKVTTHMEINGAGGVSWVKVSQSTLGSAKVEQCLVRVMQRMRFPPCKGGGTAEITYPWIFKSTGN